MKYKKCVYFVEGPCEKRFVDALNKEQPFLLMPGKVHVCNLVHERILFTLVQAIQPGTQVVFVFDTDVEKTDILLENIAYVKSYVSSVSLISIAQVLNFEDEITKAPDVKKAQDLTRSASVKDFKNDFCKMKQDSCRSLLKRHHLDLNKMWVTKPPEAFSFIKLESERIKIRSK